MKLFTKDINQKLFAQYRIGSNLNNQKVVAKIFNPYGEGRWYLLNSDPNDPDYLWAIVQMGDNVEIGSVSRSELERVRVKPFGLPLERDIYFNERVAIEVLEGLEKGQTFAAGGMTAGRWYKDNSGKEFRYIGESQGKLLFNDGEKIIQKDEEDFEDAPKEKKLFGFFEEGGEINFGEDLGDGFFIGNDVYITDSSSMYKGKTGFISGLAGKDLLVTILENGNEKNILVRKKGAEIIDAPMAKGGIVTLYDDYDKDAGYIIEKENKYWTGKNWSDVKAYAESYKTKQEAEKKLKSIKMDKGGLLKISISDIEDSDFQSLSQIFESNDAAFYVDESEEYVKMDLKGLSDGDDKEQALEIIGKYDVKRMAMGGTTPRTVKLTLSDKDSYDYTYKQDGATASITFGFGKEPFQYEVKKISKSLEPLKQDILDAFTIQGIKQHEYKGGFSEAIKHLDTKVVYEDNFAKGGVTSKTGSPLKDDELSKMYQRLKTKKDEGSKLDANEEYALKKSEYLLKNKGLLKSNDKMADGGEMDSDDDDIDYNSISDLQSERNRLVRWSNQYGSKGADYTIKKLEERIEYLKSKDNKMADGGEMDSDDGENESFEKKVKDAMKHPNKWYFIADYVGDKKVVLKMFVGVKEVDVQIFKIDGLHAKMPRNYSGRRDTLKMIMDNIEPKMAMGGKINLTSKYKVPKYKVGDRITHKWLGEGEIIKIIDEDNFSEGYVVQMDNQKKGNYYNINEWDILHKEKMVKGGKLVGKQKNLDVNKNGKLDAEDFKMLRGEKMAKGGKIVAYEVAYEKLVDGERENDIKSFKTKQEAEDFAKENYGYVENVYEGQYAKGGKVKFEDKVKAIKASLLKRKKVSPKVQKDYGKTYSPKEAEESAKRIAGALRAKYDLKKKFKKGGKTIAQTPAPKKDRVFGSSTNKPGSASSKKTASKIELNESILKTLSEKAKTYNEKHSSKVSTSTLKAVMRRGMGAYSTSHRPTISGGAPNSRQAWGFARVNKFLLKKGGTKVKAAYVQDDDLL